jgi:hypothetical protein
VSQPIAVAPGQVWSANGYVMGHQLTYDATMQAQILLGWFDSSGTAYPTTVAGDTGGLFTFLVSGGQWVRVNVLPDTASGIQGAAVPDTASWLRVLLQTSITTTTLATPSPVVDVYWDRIVAQQIS